MQLMILKILQEHNIVTMDFLKEKLSFSERKIREGLRELRQQEVQHGFKITTINKGGYLFQITDETKFQVFLERQNNIVSQEVGRKEYRVSLIIFLLLQNAGYISLNQIAEILEVSRGTVLNDMEEVKTELTKNGINLESRTGYGVKVTGDEKSIRHLLSRISGRIENHSVALEFFEFIAELDFSSEMEKFLSLLHKYNINITNTAIESILFHLKILIYRIKQNNYINEINIHRELIDTTTYKVANEIISFIEGRHNIKITDDEIDLVASQIFGKANSENASHEQREKLLASIQLAMQAVDDEYATTFAEDEVLKENLLLHIQPLLMRVSSDLSLSNSLVNSISVRYMNAFLVAMRFIDFHPELHNYELSRDEIGYLALHFATHLEKRTQEKFLKIKKIVLVVDDRRSSAILLKTKLQSFFPFSTILDIPYSSVQRHSMEDIELIISTVEIDVPEQQHKVVVINGTIDEQAIRKIKNEMLINGTELIRGTLGLQALFQEELFEIYESVDEDYLTLIQNMCEKMVDKGYAQEGFVRSVLEREARFSTIYDNGIASPHSLTQLANIDSIGVILLKKPIYYNNKTVHCIFVLNVKKGHLLLHQEISDFIVRLMSDAHKVGLLRFVNTYQKFCEFIEELL